MPSQQRGAEVPGASGRDAIAPGADGRGGPGMAIEPVVRGAVHDAGFELERVDVQQAGRRKLVKVVVDAEEGVGLDDIAEVSRAVSSALDEHDSMLGGAYTLEVTSPGVDRPLTRPRHWRRAKLRLVKLRTVDGEQFTGRVGVADTDDDGGVAVLIAGVLRRFDYARIEHAVVEVEFKQPPQDEIDLCAGVIEEDVR